MAESMKEMDNSMTSDKPHEECGVFGIWSPSRSQAAKRIYFGLIALQHRGQESAGMAVCDTFGPIGNIAGHKGMGLVSEIFDTDAIAKLKGNIGIGHVRYSTTGESVVENAQPIFLNYSKGTLALAHNGNITNSGELRDELISEGAMFSGSTDSEVVAYFIAKERMSCRSIEEAARRVTGRLRGGYALLILSPKKLIGIRDPLGLKPLILGKVENDYVLASESTALSAVGAEIIRDIAPGEMVTITGDAIKFERIHSDEKLAHCIFEYIYFAKLDSVIDGISVYEARAAGGRSLAKRYPVEADIVTGVPESGLTAAVGYSEQSGIPFKLAFSRNSYVGRTFIKPSQKERESAVSMKLKVIESVVRGKRVVLIDDSIVRGTTIANLISMMKKAGALQVHVRISSPPFLYPCYYGTDVPDNSQLIANEYSVEEIRKKIGADSLGYMKIEDFHEMTGDLPLCKACFNNAYPL